MFYECGNFPRKSVTYVFSVDHAISDCNFVNLNYFKSLIFFIGPESNS